ncbi:MAG: hypothetical protein GF346_00650, partial [Candidatus Eisenbacteria bacterium]|nr:hypothetical protein [Candidatus Latescibacterota bacterium]MBD3300940.1 hypothetical protein [Candidatus Eisenbacteria bacterium]
SLAANDTYRFFAPLDDLLRIGPTGTNVMDVQILLVGDWSHSADSGEYPRQGRP